MKIYLLWQSENRGYDTYDSCVVCAESEEEAKKIKPDESDWDDEWGFHDWVDSPDKVQCKEIGVANNDQIKGVVCASFNAG